MFKFQANFYTTDKKTSEWTQKELEKLLQAKALGFVNATQDSALWAAMEKRVQELQQDFQTLVVIGIGGSSLGPQAIVEAFEHPQNPRRVLFIDNLDALAFDKLLKRLDDLSSTAWLISSKSGGTLETLVAADYVLPLYQKSPELLKKNFTVMTTPDGNPLHALAKEFFIPVLEIPKDVGGRFSVLTGVGMIPAGFLGLRLGQFREGAGLAVESLPKVAEMAVQSLMSFQRDEWITQFWFYSSEMRTFGSWLQQLWAESLGKKNNLRGGPAPRTSTPMVAVGACDQHSILQQVIEGTHDKYVVLHRLGTSERGPYPLEKTAFPIHSHLVGKDMGQVLAAEATATQSALNQSGVSTTTLYIDSLDPKTLGFLFMFWQLVVVGIAQALELNAFDQPGVELGKRLAKEELTKR